MDSNTLYYSLDLVAGNGYTLNREQRAALQTSLLILKKNYKFTRVMFWGKILGIKEDYFIAQGKGDDEINDKKYLYSFNCFDWHLLPTVEDNMIVEVSKATKGRFTGDPSHEYEHVETMVETHAEGEEEHVETHAGGEGDAEALEEKVTIKVNEEKRLVVTIHQIDDDVSVVPRGAFIRTCHGVVQTNRRFEGLSHSDARKLDNFLHFTKPKKLVTPDSSIDFLGSLSDDIPNGQWSLQFENAGNVCMVRSLLWFGLTFYHIPMTSQHGYVYMGDGCKNLDLPFML